MFQQVPSSLRPENIGSTQFIEQSEMISHSNTFQNTARSRQASTDQPMNLQFSREIKKPKTPEVNLAGVIIALESVCRRLEQTIDSQNQRLQNIEICLSQTLTDRFDRLIDIGNLASVSLGKMVEMGLHAKALNSEAIQTAVTVVNSQQSQAVQSFQKSQQNGSSKMIPSPAKLQPVQTVAQQLPRQNPAQFFSRPQNFGDVALRPIRQPDILSELKMNRALDKETLMSIIKKKLGHYCSDLTERTYRDYVTNKIDLKQLKSKYSWSLMDFMVILTRDLKANEQQIRPIVSSSRVQIMIMVDEALRNVLEFLIQKYPPSKYKVVDTELARHVTQMNRIGDTKYDILKNAHMSFVDDTGLKNFTRQIKVWLNRIIFQTRRVYPLFKSKIKELFVDDDNTFDADSDVDFAIDCKISQNVDPYTQEELDMPELNIKSPQIARILVKWIEELLANFFNPKPKILANKYGFKSVSGVGMVLPSRRKQVLLKNLQAINDQKLTPIRIRRRKHMFTFLNEVLKLVTPGVLGNDELLQDEVVNTKIAQFLVQCNQDFMNIILSTCMHLLNSVRKKYPGNQAQSNIDLISFGVMDLLRSKCIGPKKAIKRIYNSLRSSAYLKIIRVKNKLNQSTRDILINFKINDSFLVGQMQLALGDCKDDVNDHFCHYLYELQRSFLPVMFEVANQINSSDTRISYFNDRRPVAFKNSEQTKNIYCKQLKPMCAHKHSQAEIGFKTNMLPFSCLVCCTFFKAYTFSLQYGRCPECDMSVCPICMIKKMPELEQIYLKQCVNTKKIEPFIVGSYSTFFGNYQNLKKKLQQILKTDRYVVAFTLDRQGCKSNIYKKVGNEIIPTFYTIDAMRTDKVQSSKHNWNAIVRLGESTILKLNDIVNFQKWVVQKDMPSFEAEANLRAVGISEVNVIPLVGKKQVLLIDMEESHGAIHEQMDKQRTVAGLREQDAKGQACIELTSKGLSDLGMLSYIYLPEKVRVINLWENQLDSSCIDSLKRFKNVADLQLKQNKIDSINGFLKFQQLQVLNLENNCVAGPLPKVDTLPGLYLLALSNNRITDISTLSSTNSNKLTFLFLQNNKLSSIPTMYLSELELLEFSNNEVVSLENICKSSLPSLKRLRASNNRIAGPIPVLNLPELELLKLDHNQISDINALAKSAIPQILEINLSNNCIQGDLPIIKFEKLQKIVFMHNKISSIVSLEKWSLPYCSLIGLSYNEISEVPVLSLPLLDSLELCHNSITDISSLNNSRINKIRKLGLSHNRVYKLGNPSIPSLEQLDLSYNLLSDITSLAQCRLFRLRVLDLSHNQIKTPVPILDMPNLAQLKLEANDIPELQCLTEPQLIPMMEHISIDGNQKLAKLGSAVDFDVDRRYAYRERSKWEYRGGKQGEE